MARTRCEQPTKAGKPCRNSVSFEAQYAAKDPQLAVCGTHANSLWQQGWLVREVVATFTAKPTSTTGP